MFMNIMDVTIVNVALPTIGREFDVRTRPVATVSIAYLVSLAVFIPASGWLGDRFGGRRILLIAIVLFTGASALCGAADSLGQLVFFRVLQGAGGGLMVPVGMAMLYRTFPPSERVRASSIMVVPDRSGAGPGPGDRRPVRHQPLVALGLLRQRSDRHRRPDLWFPVPASLSDRRTRAGSTWSDSSWRPPAWGC